ncbi:MAG: EF-hand domain-containing protein [Elstera sp.]
MVSSIGSGGFSTSALTQYRQQLFTRADANGDGKLDADEIDTDLKSNAPQGIDGQAPTGTEIVSQLDTDGDGGVSQEEFANAKPPQGGRFDSGTASTLLSAQEEATQALLKLFERSDSNNDGDVTEDEFTSYLKDAVDDEELTASESFSKAIANLFASQDTNGDGVVNALDRQATSSSSTTSSLSDALLEQA